MYATPPGSGDDLQASKKGIMEIADLVLVTKYDSEFQKACRGMKMQIEQSLHLSRPKLESWTVPVHMVSSFENINIDKVWEAANKFRSEHELYI